MKKCEADPIIVYQIDEAIATCARIAQAQNEGGRIVCRIASLHRLTRRHGGTAFSQVAAGLAQMCLREGLSLARPPQFVLTQSGLWPGEGRRTGGSRRAFHPPRSHVRSHLAFGHVLLSEILTRKMSSRRMRSTPPATLPLPREAALCFNKKGNCKARTRQYPPAAGCPRSGCPSMGAHPSRLFNQTGQEANSECVLT